MAQAQNVSANAVSGIQPLSYLNQNQPATVLFVRQSRAPTTSDRRFKFGTIWLDTGANTVYALVNVTNNSAFWSLLGAGSGDLDTLTADSGGAIGPSLGNINLTGSQNISTAGSGNSITFATPPTITADAFDTGDTASGLRISTNVIEGEGTDGDIDITLTPKGTGDTKLNAGSLSIEIAGEGLNIKEGANARMGTVVLAAGNATVPTTAVTSNSRIFLTYQALGVSLGILRIETVVDGVSFDITSGTAFDSSTVAWVIIEPV